MADQLTRYLPRVVSLTIAILALAWMWQASIIPVNEPYDSLLYLRGAEYLLRGEWLGPYDQLTLVRQPLYSMFLVLNADAGLPLHFAQQLLYLLSVALLALALRNAGISGARTAWLFALCALHPVGVYLPTFVISEALYVPLSTMLLAGSIGVVATFSRKGWAYPAWLALLCSALAGVWHTRPEGVWTLPFLAIGLGLVLRHCGSQRQRIAKRLPFLLLLPPAAVLTTGMLLAAKNHATYGIGLVHELDDPHFRAAFNWLTRLAPETRRAHVPITREGLATAFAVSPSFARLRDFLDPRGSGQAWVTAGCRWMDICDELAGGWAVWAIRDGVAELGLYSEPGQAAQFYAKVARDLRYACARGQITCSANTTGNFLAPPIFPSDAFRLLLSGLTLGEKAITLERFTPTVVELHHAQRSAAVVKRYADVTHDAGHRWPQRILVRVEPHVITYGLGQIAMVVLLGLAFLAALRHPRQLNLGATMPSAAMLVSFFFVISRLAALSYLDSMSYAVHIRYLAVVYPALTGMAVLAFPYIFKGGIDGLSSKHV